MMNNEINIKLVIATILAFSKIPHSVGLDEKLIANTAERLCKECNVDPNTNIRNIW